MSCERGSRRSHQCIRLGRQRVAHLAHHAQELAQHLPHDARPARREVRALARIGGEVEELDAPLEARGVLWRGLPLSKEAGAEAVRSENLRQRRIV